MPPLTRRLLLSFPGWPTVFIGVNAPAYCLTNDASVTPIASIVSLAFHLSRPL